MDPMSYADFSTFKEPVFASVPYPQSFYENGILPPEELKPEYDQLKDDLETRERYQKKFEFRCLHDYYAEFFWFPFQHDCYVLAWKKIGVPNGDPNIGGLSSCVSEYAAWAAQAATDVIQKIPVDRKEVGLWQAKFFGTLAQDQLKVYSDFKVPIIEAIHFRRGIQNLKVLDMEVEIPIPFKSDGETIDFDIFQKAWWQVIDLVYKYEA